MKYRPSPLAALLVLVALCMAEAHARNVSPRQTCPQIRIECPDTVAPGEDVPFKVNVEGADPSWTQTYKWDVAGGAIASGQGTNSITVNRTGFEGQSLTATVEVGGLPAACGNSVSCSIISCPGPVARQWASYGDTDAKDEQARLDNFADALRTEPGAQGYIIAYAGRRARSGEAAKRLERAKNYLVNERELEAERIVIVDGGHREELTVELYIVPTGAMPPEPSPTVGLSEVEILVAPKTKRGRNPRPR